MGFKSYATNGVLLAGETVYTCPASTEAVVIGFQIANTDTVDVVRVDVEANGANLIGANTPIPVGSALAPLVGKLALEAGETIVVTPDKDAVLDVSLSILELEIV